MKTNDKKALHDLSLTELETKAAQLQKEIALAEMNNAARKLANTTSIKTMRKDLAVVLTIQKEKELQNSALVA